MGKGGDHALELKQIWILLVEYRRQRVRAQPQDAGVLLGVHRKAMIAVGYIERTAILLKNEFQLATFEDSAVMIVQDGHQHFAMEFILQRLPVDVEKAGVSRRLAVFENVRPPRVIAAHHAHVIRDNV